MNCYANSGPEIACVKCGSLISNKEASKARIKRNNSMRKRIDDSIERMKEDTLKLHQANKFENGCLRE